MSVQLSELLFICHYAFINTQKPEKMSDSMKYIIINNETANTLVHFILVITLEDKDLNGMIMLVFSLWLLINEGLN